MHVGEALLAFVLTAHCRRRFVAPHQDFGVRHVRLRPLFGPKFDGVVNNGNGDLSVDRLKQFVKVGVLTVACDVAVGADEAGARIFLLDWRIRPACVLYKIIKFRSIY